MGVTLLAWAAAAFTAYSYVEQREAGKEAKRSAERARGEEAKLRAEQRAQNASKAAQERRQQIREERVRRARIEQSAVNTGTSGSSGEMGAVSSLATTLGSNLGSNAGRIQSAQNQSILAQNAANFSGDSANAQFRANENAAGVGMGMSLFSASGGFKTIFSNTPSGTASSNPVT